MQVTVPADSPAPSEAGAALDVLPPPGAASARVPHDPLAAMPSLRQASELLSRPAALPGEWSRPLVLRHAQQGPDSLDTAVLHLEQQLLKGLDSFFHGMSSSRRVWAAALRGPLIYLRRRLIQRMSRVRGRLKSRMHA
jgi:hypothetical protein